MTRTLHHAAHHSAFYRQGLRGSNLSPERLEDMASLPLTRAHDLLSWEALLCVSLGELQRIVSLHTSGTTGPAKRLAFSRRDLDRICDFFAMGMAYLVAPGSTLAVLLPGGQRPDGVSDLLRQALTPAGIAVRCPPSQDLRQTQVTALVSWLHEIRPCALVAMPSQLRRLLRLMPDGLPGLTGVLSSAEPLDAALANALRIRWHCEVLDHYGLTEAGYGCAVECPSHNGYHIRALDILVEILSLEDGHPLPAKAVGEVVITTLGREAMPLIRYCTGDVASLLPGPCACGSPLPRLGPVLGRIVRQSSGQVRVVRLPKQRDAP